MFIMVPISEYDSKSMWVLLVFKRKDNDFKKIDILFIILVYFGFRSDDKRCTQTVNIMPLNLQTR